MFDFRLTMADGFGKPRLETGNSKLADAVASFRSRVSDFVFRPIINRPSSIVNARGGGS